MLHESDKGRRHLKKMQKLEHMSQLGLTAADPPRKGIFALRGPNSSFIDVKSHIFIEKGISTLK